MNKNGAEKNGVKYHCSEQTKVQTNEETNNTAI